MIDFDNPKVYPPIPPLNQFVRPARPRVIVIHTTENSETSGMARNVAKWCQLPPNKRGGAVSGSHAYVDSLATIRGAYDNMYTWNSKGANLESLHIEIVGRAAQTLEEWNDAYSFHALDKAAIVAAFWCQKHGIPATHLSPYDGSGTGICGHADVTAGTGQGSHTDPGPNFPWTTFIRRVQELIEPPVQQPEKEDPEMEYWKTETQGTFLVGAGSPIPYTADERVDYDAQRKAVGFAPIRTIKVPDRWVEAAKGK